MPQIQVRLEKHKGYWYLRHETTWLYMKLGGRYSKGPTWAQSWSDEGASGWSTKSGATHAAMGYGLKVLPPLPPRPPIGSPEHLTETTGMGPDERSHLG